MLSTSRVKKIASYIDAGNSIPNNVLLSLDNARISNSGNKLFIPNEADAGWVIDGQHRLAGAHEAKKTIKFIAVAYIGLSEDQQVKLFVDINREQKGVPTSLYYDLLKYLPTEKSEADIARERSADIANQLKRDENSPFYGRIVITSPKKGEISMTNFVRKLYPLLLEKKGKFHVYTLQEQLGIIDNYFKSLKNTFPEQFRPEKSTFFKTLGFGAMMNALPTVFDLALRDYQGFQVSAASKILKSVDYFDFSQWDMYGTGSAAEIQAGEDFRLELTGSLEDQEGGILKL